MNINRIMLAALLAAGLAAGCTRTVVYKEGSQREGSHGPVIVEDEKGPPPHAPAHGYRRKNADGVVLVYDTRLAVYIVSGHRDCYYSDGMYFRFMDGSWEFSATIGGGWKVVTNYHDVPAGPRGKHGNGHGHDNGNHHDQGDNDQGENGHGNGHHRD